MADIAEGQACSIYRCRPCNECSKVVKGLPETFCPACGLHFTQHNDASCRYHYEFKRATYGWIKV